MNNTIADEDEKDVVYVTIGVKESQWGFSTMVKLFYSIEFAITYSKKLTSMGYKVEVIKEIVNKHEDI